MKKVEDIVVCVVDYGTFISLADKLSETCRKVYYYSPTEDEYRNVMDCVIGDGLERPGHRIERCDDFMDPDIFAEIDLFVFPDIGWGGLQKYLRSVGKAVWGSMGADDLELYRTRFNKLLVEMKLDTIPTVTIRGVEALDAHLKTVKDKWVKINRYRENMETWHHVDYDHSRGYINFLKSEFDIMPVVFVVQDNVPTDVEIGYDGWCVDGEFPAESFQGYEKKNELYLGSARKYEQLPKQVRAVNEALAPLLKKLQYRNFIATEIRIKGDKFYFIDPTMRMPGQTGEQLLETCVNLPDVIWRGANGEVVRPQFKHKFAVEGTLHYRGEGDGWKTLRLPAKAEPWTKLYHYCVIEGLHKFPPGANDELGVLLGVGDTIAAAIAHLKANMELFKDEPVKVNVEKFADLLEAVAVAERHGVPFTEQKIPGPASVLGK